MTLTLNGKPHQAADGLTLAALLAELDLDPQRVAVEHNRDIVPRERFDATFLADGDTLEIVQFVGGG